MAYTASVVLCMCLVASGAMAQFYPPLTGISPLLFGDRLDGGGGTSFLLYQNMQLQQQMQALTARVLSGTIGGCESGVVGPLNSVNPQATIVFRTQFTRAPALIASLSGITSQNPTIVTSVRIAPATITPTNAIIGFQDGVPPNINAAFVSYMACPHSAS